MQIESESNSGITEIVLKETIKTIQYIQYKVMKVLSTSINFTEIANYEN